MSKHREYALLFRGLFTFPPFLAILAVISQTFTQGMELTELLSIFTPVLLAALAWYYKRDADQSQAMIKALNLNVEELKALMRIHTTNYEHLLREVQEIAGDTKQNSKDISQIERELNNKINGLCLDFERHKAATKTN